MDFSIEIVHLKEDLYKELREIEDKFKNMFVKKTSEIENKNQSSLEKIDIMMTKNEEMFNSINIQQVKFEKIEEFDSFKNKINDMVMTHEFRIKSLSKDFENIKFKYDREITQNLQVPGFVGPNCQFKSISEYLLFNVAEINKLKGEKDLTKKENKEIRAKFDSIMKNIFNLVDNSVKRCNEYTDNKQKYFDILLNTKLNEFNEKNMEMKTQVMINQKVVEDEINKIIKISDGLVKLKDDVESIINNKYDELNILIKELKNKIEKINNEVKKNNKNYENLNSTFKKSGILAGVNSNNFKSTNNRFQRKNSIKNGNNNPSNLNNTVNNSNSKTENNKEETKFREIKKKNTIIKRQKYTNNDSIKINKTIEKSSFDNNKESKSLNLKENKTINIASSRNKNNKSKVDTKKKSNSIFNLKNNVYKKQYNNLFNKKKEINEVNTIEEKISTERKIKNIGKKIRKNNETNKKLTLSDDEKENRKNKLKITKFFEKITTNKTNNISVKSKSKKNKNHNYQNININNLNTNINNLNENINNLNTNINNFKANFTSNNNEINNLKRFSLFHNKKNISLYTKNNLLVDKSVEANPIDKYEENSKNINYKINNKTSLYKNPKKTDPLLITQKINSINYPSNENIKNINKKDDLFQEFLERHNLKLNRSLDNKTKNQNSKKIDYFSISNRMYGTRNNNLYNNIDNYNNIYTINNQNIFLKEGEIFDFNKKKDYTQSNIKNTININTINTPENINYKLISFDNNYHSPLGRQHKVKTRNNPELILPIANVFKTFQVNKYKNIINNIEEDFPTKISPIFGRTGYSVYNKRQDNQISIKNMKNTNIYRKTKNQNQSDMDLGFAPKKIVKIYV